jgi:hypothetical protein
MSSRRARLKLLTPITDEELQAAIKRNMITLELIKQDALIKNPLPTPMRFKCTRPIDWSDVAETIVFRIFFGIFGAIVIAAVGFSVLTLGLLIF